MSLALRQGVAKTPCRCRSASDFCTSFILLQHREENLMRLCQQVPYCILSILALICYLFNIKYNNPILDLSKKYLILCLKSDEIINKLL